MRIYVEDWAAGYGSPYLVVAEESTVRDEGVVVEDASGLSVHPRPPRDRLSRVAFVDGVRRVESYLYAEADDGTLVRGVAGAHAFGAAVADGAERCRFERCRTARLVIWSHGHREELPAVAGGWSWQARSVPSAEPAAPVENLQRRMREAEGRLAEELCDAGWLTVVDGPLNFVLNRDIPVMGLVKTHHRAVLPPEDHARVPRLAAGQRTSLFRLRSDLLGCYLRLGAPPRHAGPWSGIVRLDLPASVGVAEAARSADAAAATLPEFAGVPHADPRAPQNLQPVGALERHLRHLLGDAGLAARAVRQSVAALAGGGRSLHEEVS